MNMSMRAVIVMGFAAVYLLLPLVDSAYLPSHLARSNSINLLWGLGIAVTLGALHKAWPHVKENLSQYDQMNQVLTEIKASSLMILLAWGVVFSDLLNWFMRDHIYPRTTMGYVLLLALISLLVLLTALLLWSIRLYVFPGHTQLARLLNWFNRSWWALPAANVGVLAVIVGGWLYLPSPYLLRLSSWVMLLVPGFVYHTNFVIKLGHDPSFKKRYERTLFASIAVPAGILFGLLLLLVVLKMPLPDIFQHDTRMILLYAHFLLFVLIGFQIPRYGNAVVLLAIVYFYMASMIWTWGDYRTNGVIIGGLLPWSDASGYFYGSQVSLATDISGSSASFLARRPLFTAFLTGLNVLTNNSFPWSLMLMAVIDAVAVWFLVREVKYTHGVVASLVTLLVLLLFSNRFLGGTLTEQLGLPLGVLATAVLWRGAHTRQAWLAGIGVVGLAFALVVRAGAFFVLPALLLWGIVTFWRHKPALFRYLGITIAGIALTFGTDSAARSVFIPGFTDYGGNYAYTLYGLAYDNQSWTYVYENEPDIFTDFEPGETNDEIYRRAFLQIQNDPMMLVQGMLGSLSDFIFKLESGVFSFVYLYDIGYSLIQVLYGLAAIALLIVCFKWRESPYSLLLLSSMGIFVSALLVPPIDADLMRVYATTIPFVAVIVSIGAAALFRAIDLMSPVVPQVPAQSTGLISSLVGLVFMSTVFPIGHHLFLPDINAKVAVCQDKEIAFYGEFHPDNSLHIVADGNTPTKTLFTLTNADFIGITREKYKNTYPYIVAFAENLDSDVFITYSANLASQGTPAQSMLIIDDDLGLSAGRHALCGEELTNKDETLMGYQSLRIRRVDD